MTTDRILAQRYKLLHQRGAGGLGEVWVAEDLNVNRRVAIKMLRRADASVLERFRREATATASLEHASIVRVHDFFMEKQTPYLVMELLEGVSLSELVHAMGRLDSVRAARLAALVAAGLHFAHERGVVHRDIKPGNIQVVPEPSGSESAKILDFGIAKVFDATTLTATGATMGTPGFMAPEQATGESIDARTDVYALGVTLYYVLTAQLPYSGKTPQEILAQVTTGAVTPLSQVRPDIDRRLERIVQRAMHREGAQRYPTAGAMQHELEHWIDASHGAGTLVSQAPGPASLPSSKDVTVDLGPRSPSAPTTGARLRVSSPPSKPSVARRAGIAAGAVLLVGLIAAATLVAGGLFLLREQIWGEVMEGDSPGATDTSSQRPAASDSTLAATSESPLGPPGESSGSSPTHAGSPRGQSAQPQPKPGLPPATATATASAPPTQPAKKCDKGLERCDGRCVNTLVHPGHCGRCGNACKPDEYCYGRCTKCNFGGYATCNGKCTRILTDRNNCGACGRQCRLGSCQNGRCCTTDRKTGKRECK